MNADHEEAVEFAKTSKRENRVYVGNLSYDVKYRDLMEFMRGGGWGNLRLVFRSLWCGRGEGVAWSLAFVLREHAWGQRCDFFFEFCIFFGFSLLRRASCDFSFLIDGMVETVRILMGVFFWGCQLVRSYSPKCSSHQLAYPKDAGKLLSSITRKFSLTIKLASSNSPHKKIRSGRFVNYPKPPC
jgi:hypothetical protein